MERKKIALLVIFLIIFAGLAYFIFQYYEYWNLENVRGYQILISDEFDGDRGYNAFPKAVRISNTDINQHDGEILTVWYNGDGHVDDEGDGKIFGSYSEDEGKSWTTPEIIYDDPVLDCRNIGILCAQNGTLVIFFAKVNVSKIDTNKTAAWEDFGYILSYDGGESWSEFHSLIQDESFKEMGIITGNGYGDAVFINGKIYILCYGYPDIEFEETHVAFLLTSDDNGETWELESNLSLNTGTSTSEADFTYSNEQNLLFGFSRSQNTDPRYLYYLESSDKGTNWNHLMKLGAQGDCPDIFRLSDGRYIVIIRAYGNRNVYMGYFTLPSEFPSLSYANKTNLLENIKIECMVKGTFGTSHGDIAYPSIVSLEDGKIMIAYYDIGAGGVFAKLIDEENI